MIDRIAFDYAPIIFMDKKEPFAIKKVGFTEYHVNSDEFKIDEIKRLKTKNEDEYISKYIYLAKNLIEYFSK